MAKYAIRYIGDNKTIEHHEEALRIAALSAAQAKFISTLLVCYPNQIENEEISALGQLFESLAYNVDEFLKAERERFDRNSEVRP